MTITRDHRLLAMGLIPCIAVSVAALFAVPWFKGIFTSAGLGDIWSPWPYRLLLATYPWWGVTALITLAVWRFWPSADQRGNAAAQFGLWCFIVLFVFGVIGCYAPIFGLTGNR